ncbi:MAG: GNAT family N-acetyltransferase [Acidobacteriota bacterium]|nr:GNAT family N-acetyltransferase [Acidobacteriota bacterium]
MSKILETERLILRHWSVADADALFEICRDAEVMRYIGTRKPYATRAEAEKFLHWAVAYQKENGFCRWAVVEKASGKIIGSCGFAYPHGMPEIELGYLFDRAVWGKGFATEAARACLDYGFGKLGFREIIAITDLENIASQKVLEKIGFTQRGVENIDGEDALVYLAKI